MSAYVIQRILLMLLTLLGMSIIIFVLLRLVPGNIVDIMFDSAGFVDPSEKASIEKELGLDLPIYQQYFDWITALLVGDLGFSFVSEMPAIDEIGPRIPITAKLAALSLFFSILFGLPLGVISAVRQNTTLDYVLRVISLSGLSLPSFWLALLILMACVSYMGAIPIYTETPETLWDELLLYLLPSAAVGFRASALIMRLTRSSMLEVMRQDYIRTAYAKGLDTFVIIKRHIMKNALNPIVTSVSGWFASMLAGAVFVEYIFAWNGIGKEIVEALNNMDLPVVMGCVLLIALVFIIINLLVDVVYLLLDPRAK